MRGAELERGFLSNFTRISGSGLHSMGSRHFGWRVTHVVVRLVDAFEASFRQIFGSFLNMEGFCWVFIPSSRGFCPVHKMKIFFWASV